MLDCIPISYQCCAQTQCKAVWAMTRPFENSQKGKHHFHKAPAISISFLFWLITWHIFQIECKNVPRIMRKTDYDADIFHAFVGVYSVVFDSFTHFEWLRVSTGTSQNTNCCLCSSLIHLSACDLEIDWSSSSLRTFQFLKCTRRNRGTRRKEAYRSVTHWCFLHGGLFDFSIWQMLM